MKKLGIVIGFFLLAVLGLTMSACGVFPFFANSLFPADANEALDFDIAGAKAIAGSDSEARSILASRGLAPRAADDQAALVKIMDDGSVVNAIDFGDDSGWRPSISFISTGDDGSVYICFERAYNSWSGDHQEWIQFVRVYPDNQYDILWPPASVTDWSDMDALGQIDVWGWDWLDQDPLVRGPDGKLYFKVSSWSGSSNSSHIYVYDPSIGGSAVRKTPESAELEFERFMVDANNRLFIQAGGNWGSSDSASYLRYYPEGSIGYETIYYASDSQSMWTRGVVSSPDGSYVVMNGNGIRDMNGIIKVTIDESTNGVGEYDLLYGNANGGGNWIQLIQHYGNTWSNGTELLSQTAQSWEAGAYKWQDDILTGGDVDETKLLTKIQPYFYGDVTIKAGTDLRTALDGAAAPAMTVTLNDPLGEVKDWDNSDYDIWQWLDQYSDDFLDRFFEGKLFSEWLSENDLTELNFDNIGSMLWDSDQALYGLYDQSWWGGGGSSTNSGTKVIKLLDGNGEQDLQAIDMPFGDQFPSSIQIVGDTIYYRYANLDGAGQETGTHFLARYNIKTEEGGKILPDDVEEMEILSYDVSGSQTELYFVGLNPQTNEVIKGNIDLTSGTWERIESAHKLTNIKVIE